VQRKRRFSEDMRTTKDRPTTIAVLGTGRMGDAIAHKLLAAGFAVRVWNRTREHAAAAVAAGAAAARTPADAAAEAEIVLTMLTGGSAVGSVMGADGGGALEAMAPGCTWIQMGTIGLSWTDEFGARAAARGVAFVDAPVSGGDNAALAGTLLVLAAGTDDALARVQPIFDAIGRRTLWLGAPGNGSRLKLAIDNWLACLVESLAETLSFTGALGLDPRCLVDAVHDGPLASPYVMGKARAMLHGDDAPGFSLANALESAVMAQRLARDLGLQLPLTDALVQRWSPAAADGLGDRDVSAVVQLAGDMLPNDHDPEGTPMPEQRPNATDLPCGTFAEGQAEPDRFPDDARVGRFSDKER
jgi:3-hydroxyisobutyrate dehydrogenase